MCLLALADRGRRKGASPLDPDRILGSAVKLEECIAAAIDNKPAVHVSRVVDVSNPTVPIVELTVSARVKPSDTDAVKQKLLDRAAILVSPGPSERLEQASG
jgi:hypothetical protein